MHHLTSTIEGRLGAGHDAIDLLHACFPGGSITGAPKLRAIEILDALEPMRRHIYTGAIGYVDWCGAADWNVAIRTALVTPHALHFAAGGFLAFLNLPADAKGTATIESKTNFLGPVREGYVHGVTRALHKGKRTIVVDTELFDDAGKLVARVTQTQAVL